MDELVIRRERLALIAENRRLAQTRRVSTRVRGKLNKKNREILRRNTDMHKYSNNKFSVHLFLHFLRTPFKFICGSY